MSTDARKEQEPVNKRLDEVGWALLLILTGAVCLLPERRLPDGFWLMGVGVIILGLGGVRNYRGVKVSGFTLIVGSLALISGLATAFAVKLPLFAILFILLGAGLLLRPCFQKDDGMPSAHPPRP